MSLEKGGSRFMRLGEMLARQEVKWWQENAEPEIEIHGVVAISDPSEDLVIYRWQPIDLTEPHVRIFDFREQKVYAAVISSWFPTRIALYQLPDLPIKGEDVSALFDLRGMGGWEPTRIGRPDLERLLRMINDLCATGKWRDWIITENPLSWIRWTGRCIRHKSLAMKVSRLSPDKTKSVVERLATQNIDIVRWLWS